MALEFQQNLLDGIPDLNLKLKCAWEVHPTSAMRRVKADFIGTLDKVPDWSCFISCGWNSADNGSFFALLAENEDTNPITVRPELKVATDPTGPDDERYQYAFDKQISRLLCKREQARLYEEKRKALGGTLTLEINGEDDIKPYPWDLSFADWQTEAAVGEALRNGKKIHAIMIPKGGNSPLEVAAFAMQTNKFNDEVLRGKPRPTVIKLDANSHTGFYCAYAY